MNLRACGPQRDRLESNQQLSQLAVMCRKRQRKQRLLLVVLSISFLGAYGFSSEQNGQYCFPVQRIETRRTLQAPFDGRRISRTLTEASPKTRRHWHLLASPILPDDSVFQNAVDFNEKGVSLGLDVESFALSGRIAQVRSPSASDRQHSRI